MKNYMAKTKKIAMSIAGSDSSGGAGVQADLKIFSALGLHGITAITCITSQNTQEVKNIHKLPIEIIESQIDTLLLDMNPNAVKTGMLFDEEIVKIVSKKIKQHSLKVVVDPVMVATSQDDLSSKNFPDAIKKEILPITYILTPNIYEASILTGIKVDGLESVKKACEKLHEMGPEYVLIKGGHLTGGVVEDVLYDGEKFNVFSLPRIPDKKAHGSGCSISALITGYLALEDEPLTAISKAKNVLWNMINDGYNPGKGADVLNFDRQVIENMPLSFETDKHFEVWYDLKKTVEGLPSFLTNEYVAEVGMNIGYALDFAEKPEEVCAVNGRIIKTKNKPRVCGPLMFGVSKHIASVILAAMNYDSSKRCAMNIRYSEKLLNLCEKTGLKIGSFNRADEPENVKSTMEWGTSSVVNQLGFVPDFIYDIGGVGKEPMIRVLGKNPDDVLNKIKLLTK